MKQLYMISNAHIDPVWQWQWQEGVGVAITTFSAAADFCEEFENYIFCHNEAILYEWVYEHDRKLFERIAGLVDRGKWHIMGGWYLQPDCNMPSGESIIRHILRGHKFFSEHFPSYKGNKVAINFDSFGHSRGLVQILRDAQYEGYVCMRPEVANSDRDMQWKGFNDSEITVHRVSEGYNSFLGKVDKKLEPFIENCMKKDKGMFLWGVGNHGGGPSREDYKIIGELQKKYTEIEFKHATPEQYFDAIAPRKSELVDCGDLNHVNMGCYTSQVRIKQMHMLLENELFSAEKMTAHAAACGMKTDSDLLKRAFDDLMFTQFHDILPGTSIKSAEEAALRTLGHGLEEVAKAKIKAFFVLAGGEKKADVGEYPIILYNPHPTQITKTVECEFMLADQNRCQTHHYKIEAYYNGNKIYSQIEKEESNIPIDWRKKVVFTITMPPCSINRVSLFATLEPVQFKNAWAAEEDFVFDNGSLKAVIDAKTGLLKSVTKNGEQYLKESCKLSVIKNSCDPWGFFYNSYREELGTFELLDEVQSAEFAAVECKTLCPVRVIEKGEVRTVVEALLGYKSSRLAIQYKFYPNKDVIEVSLIVHNDLKDVKLKLDICSAFKMSQLIGKTMFGQNSLPFGEGKEVVAQEYVLMTDGKKTVSVMNFGNYGLSADADRARLTLLNSSAYSAHPVDDRVIMKADRYGHRIDMGERQFEFVLGFGKADERAENIEHESTTEHQPPYVMAYFPTGHGSKCGEFMKISNIAVSLNALKLAEDGNGMIIRLFNSLNRAEETDLQIEGDKLHIKLNPFEYTSLRYFGGKFTKVNCLEK